MSGRKAKQKILALKINDTTSLIRFFKAFSFISLLVILLISHTFSSVTTHVAIKNSGRIITAALPLHTEGRYIKNSLGEIVILKGVTIHGFEDQPEGKWDPPDSSRFYSWEECVKANLDAIRSWGLNTIRLHTSIDFWIDNPETSTGYTYRENIKKIIEWAAERGIYVIFDFYCVVHYGVEGHQQDPLPYPPYIQDGVPEVYMPNSTAFVNLWTDVAQELCGYPNVIFELFNEPQPGVVDSGIPGDPERFCYYNSTWLFVAQQIIDNIRGMGISNLIIVQCGMSIWCNLSSPPHSQPHECIRWIVYGDIEGNKINGTNIVYSTHFYRGDFHRSRPEWINCYNYTDIKLALQLCCVEEAVKEWNVSLFIGELGCNYWKKGTDDWLNELAFFNNSLTILNEWNISWAAFWWYHSGPYQLYTLPNFQPNEAGEIVIAKAE